MSKLQKLLEIEGYENTEDFLENGNPYDSILPGICMNKKCNFVKDVEPDCSDGFCENCKTNSVVSIFYLICDGII